MADIEKAANGRNEHTTNGYSSNGNGQQLYSSQPRPSRIGNPGALYVPIINIRLFLTHYS